MILLLAMIVVVYETNRIDIGALAQCGSAEISDRLNPIVHIPGMTNRDRAIPVVIR